jgi:hypothetical protein
MGRIRGLRRAGKWGRAIHLEDRRVAPNSLSMGDNPEIFATHATPVVSSMNVNNDVIDLYLIRQSKTTMNTTGEEAPFVHEINIIGPKREVSTVRALFNGGAMVSAMCTTAFNRAQHRLGDTLQSRRGLRMADGTVVPSQRRWERPIELGNARVNGGFEVFDSKGGWDFLFGKPLLQRFKVIHDYGADTVTVRHPHTGTMTVLRNQTHLPNASTTNEKSIRLTLDVEQQENITGGTSGKNPPSRQVPSTTYKTIQPFKLHDKSIENVDQKPFTGDKATIDATITMSPTGPEIEEEVSTHSNNSGGKEQPPSREVTIDLEIDHQTHNANDIPMYGPDKLVQVHHVKTSNIYTRHTDPFKPERIAQILSEITIGSNTTPDER